jgi:hypothetical protein
MMRSRWLILVLPLTLIIFVLLALDFGYTPYLVRLYALSGLRTMHRAARVEAYRVYGPGTLRAIGEQHFQPTSRPTTQQLLDLDILSGPVTLNDLQRSRLRSLLDNPDTYGHGRVSACSFNPDVAYRFIDGAGSDVVIVLCFHCDDLHVHVHGGEPRLDSFDANRAAMLELTKELFPDDPYIQQFSSRSPFQR